MTPGDPHGDAGTRPGRSASAGLRILVVAHDYPPNDSPQSLRTAYQVRELVRSGYEVQVLTPDHAGPDEPLIPDQADVPIRRSFPGPLAGLVAAVSRRRHAGASTASGAGDVRPGVPHVEPPLNWRGRQVKRLRHVLDHVLFPDHRAEWLPWARRALDRAVAEFSPDLVIAAHEPAAGLLLGLRAKRQHGIPLLVDLGDPVAAPYTPAIWRRRALRLEAAVCREADAVVVTSHETRNTLVERHGAQRSNLVVLPQGFDDAMPDAPQGSHRSVGDVLRLLYTGRFYPFRDPIPLLAAVVETPGVHLSLACQELTPDAAAFIARYPDRIRFLGKVSHRDARDLQRGADVLVNIGNAGMCQVPGKFFEYFGAGRPILHVSETDDDEPAVMLKELRRGIAVASDPDSIAAALRSLRHLADANQLGRTFDLSSERVAMFGWTRHGEKLSSLCAEIAAPRHGG